MGDNQHIYVSRQKTLLTVSDSMGLLLTLTLGGLGMFLLVLALTFMIVQMMMRNTGQTTEERDSLVNDDEKDGLDELENNKSIFTIETGETFETGEQDEEKEMFSSNWKQKWKIKKYFEEK